MLTQIEFRCNVNASRRYGEGRFELEESEIGAFLGGFLVDMGLVEVIVLEGEFGLGTLAAEETGRGHHGLMTDGDLEENVNSHPNQHLR